MIDASRVDITPLLPYFSSNKWLKIIQNSKFDTKFLLYYHKVRTRNVFDTFLAERLLSNHEGYGGSNLKALAKKYLDITLDKDIRESFINMPAVEAFSEEQLDYAAKDVEVLWAIMQAQREKLEGFGMSKVSELEFDLAPIVGSMELTGVPIDQRKWRQQIEDFNVQHEESRLAMNSQLFDHDNVSEQLGMFVRDAINLNSPKQLKQAFLKLGIDIDSTSEREIALIDHPAAKELLKYRELQKIKTSYGSSFLDKIHPFTQRIHPSWEQIGTATGRFSCKDPNLQQMPEVFRKCVSDKDSLIIGADFAGIELRLLAELSGDPALLEAFNKGDDPHTATASKMFRVPLDNVTKEQRHIGKTLNFGISYGMGPNKLMDTLNHEKPKKEQLTFRQVSEMHKLYKETHKTAVEWLFAMGNAAYRQSYSTTLYGRRRFFNRPTQGPDWDKEVASIKRQGANSIIQGSSADMTKIAMRNLYEDLNQYDYKAQVILQVHDEIAVLAHRTQAQPIKILIEDSMIRSGQELLKKVPVKVESYISEMWAKE